MESGSIFSDIRHRQIPKKRAVMNSNNTFSSLCKIEYKMKPFPLRRKSTARLDRKISKLRYIVEQYFGINHLHDGAKRARFTTITKNKMDCWYRQAAFNITRGLKILRLVTA